MTNEEYLRAFGKFYDKFISIRKDEDYVVNMKQASKFTEIMRFFEDTASNLGGTVEPITLTPHDEHGGVTAIFPVFDVSGENVKRFSSVMKYASAIGIDPTEDGVCISVTVPNIFVRK